jgi:integrase
MPTKGDGITKRKDGRYMARYTVHTPDGPKRKLIYGRKYKEVANKLAEARGDAARGIFFDAHSLTLGQWLERWLEGVVKPSKTHRTYATHLQQVRSHITPALGRVKLEALRKAHIDRLYNDLLRAKPEGAGLAPSSVRRVHAVLHAALEEAVRGDLIPRNPATHANKPKVRQKEIEPLDTKQAVALLDAARGDRYEALYVLCLTAGLRQGEALGLKWSDIDLDAGTLRVNRQLQRVRRDGARSGLLVFSEPKNASRRTVALPPRAVRSLREHRKPQLEQKLKASSEWQDNGLVFTNSKGKPLEAQNVVNRSFKPLLKRAGLPPIRFHDLRHSCLSLLASRGEPIRDLQAIAGHATASFTLQRYTHHYDSSAKRTAETMGEIFPDNP